MTRNTCVLVCVLHEIIAVCHAEDWLNLKENTDSFLENILQLKNK